MAFKVSTLISRAITTTSYRLLDFSLKASARDMGRAAVDGIKQSVAAGKSPIRGQRFAQYLGKRRKGAAKRRSYPYNVMHKYPGKKDRPVNLHLSGDFLDGLGFDVKKNKGQWSVLIGYEGKKSADKEIGHRIGVNGQPSRPTIPRGSEKFIGKIQTAIRNAVRKRLGKDAKKFY